MRDLALATRQAWPVLAHTTAAVRDSLLRDLADRLEAGTDAILRANADSRARAPLATKRTLTGR